MIGLSSLSAHSANQPLTATKSTKKADQTSSLTKIAPVIPSFRKNLDTTIGYKASTTSLSSSLDAALLLTPHISISPTTGTLGVTNFTETYTGFTHNGSITENVTYPNGGLTIYHVTADSNGNATIPFTLTSQSGNYSSFAVDDATGVHSNTITYTVTAPAPVISSLSPSSYPASGSSQTLTVNGSNFQTSATLTFHDPQGNVYAGRATNFISSSQLTHPFNNGSDAGTWTVFVVNPDGKTSNTWSFSVTAAVPGVPVLTLTAECSGTTSQIRLNWTAASGATSYDVYRNFAVYTTGITGTQFINNLVTPGTTYSYSVLARNSSGSTGSATQSATAPNCAAPAPVITGLSPSSYPASGSSQTLTVNGSNFVSGATLTFHDPQGNAYPGRSTTFISSSQLTHPFNNGNDVGTWTVFVVNPDGQTSNTWSFSVTQIVNPHISISPTTGTLGVTNFTESYSGFTRNGTITENTTYPNGGLNVFHLTADANGSTSAPFTLTSQTGSYSSYAVDDATGTHSNTITYTVSGVSNPVISTNPSSGPQLTTNFITTGSGFTQNGQVRRLLTFPNQSAPQEISRIVADGQGNVSFPYPTSCSDTPGVYTLYLIDVTTNRQSNSITETITPSAGCNPPTISINLQSGAQGATFTITGSNFTHNGQVRRLTVFPNGVTYELPGAIADNAGQVNISVSTDCTTQTGSYTTYLTDVTSGAQSIRQSYQVTASPSCTAVTSLSVAPGSATRGTAFTFAGSGFTHNSTVTLSVIRGDGQPGNGGKYNTDSSGSVSFVITSLSTDPLGQWTFRLTDDSTGRQASATAQYTAAQQSGTDAMYYTASTVDVTIPDNTQFAPGETRNKVWHIQNSGTNSWTNYQLVYVPGLINGNTSSALSPVYSLTVNASPGQWINTPNLPVTAPNVPGTYYSYWQMQNSNGINFGDRIYVKIRVVAKQNNALGFGTQSGRHGTNDSPPAKSGRNADPVDTATGNYNYVATDLKVPGRGLDVELSRSYNSQDLTQGPLGNGWSHSFNIYLTNITAAGLSVHYSDGKVLDYTSQSGTNNFVSSYPGYYDTLVNNGDGTWTLKKTDQRNYQFDTAGRLTAIRDRNNNQISLSYSGGNLAQVTDTSGRTFNFSYSGSLLTGITDPAGRALQFGYDGASNLISFRDANGNLNQYTYDTNNRLTKVIDGRSNNLVVNTYDSSGRVITQTNGRGNQWTFTYNADGSTSVFDPLSKETKYLQDTNFNLQQTVNRNANSNNLLYDERNNRAQTSDLNGNYVAYVYDQNGNITTRTDPALNSRQVVYDSKNNPTQITDETGSSTRMTYDSSGNLIGVTDALSNSLATTYDSLGQPVTVTNANGNVTTRAYDAQGDLISVKDALNNTTSYTYDGVGRRTSMTDARGKTTKYTYDANGNLLTVTDPLNNVTTYTYDANNSRISMRDARGNTTTYTYDENNSLLKEIDAKGNFTQHTYDKLDRRVSTRDKRGNVTNFTYDNEGRILTITDPLSGTTSYTYDANGNRTKITDAKNQSTLLTYDALNRVTKIQDALSNTIQKEYDAAGHLAKETDPRGNATQFAYDAIGNLTQVTDATAGAAKYSYDKNRNRIKQTDPNNHTVNLAYDKLNRLLSTSDPLNHTISYTYDEVGNRVSKTDAKGQTTRYTYDANNRLIGITYPDNSTVQFTRDANGNVTRMVDTLGTSNYNYDELNRLTSYTDPFGKTIGYQYDENGNITKLTYPDGKQVGYVFDANNRMSSFSDWAGKSTTFGYDSTNLLTTVTYPNGIVSSLTYDNAGRLIGKSDSGISSYSFTLDKNGNRTGATITQPLSNRSQNLSQSSTYDGANQIQNAGTTAFSFDNNGNMTSKTEAGAITNYAYDFENRLVLVSGSSAYLYNGDGVRLQKIENGTTTRYVVDNNHDLSQMLCETDANGTITAYYIYGMGLAYKVTPDGTHYYYHFDLIGSTIAMTDDAKTLVNSYAYDPFGSVTKNVEGTSNPFQFVGEKGVTQEANGLTFMRARFYLPSFGRFLNRDVIRGKDENSQNLNLYSYVNQNPLLNVDPSGRLVFSEAIGLDASYFVGISGELAVVADDKGNHGVAPSFGLSAGFDVGVGADVNFAITKDDTIDGVAEMGYTLGAKVGLGGHGMATLLLDRNFNVNGVAFGVGTGVEAGVSTSVTWGGVLHLSDYSYKLLLRGLGDVASAPLRAFDAAVKNRNTSAYFQQIDNAARQAPNQIQPRGPQVAPPNPVGRPTKNY